VKYNSRIYLVKTELGAPLTSTWSLYKGDILFCEKNDNTLSKDTEYHVTEILYWFNEKQSKISVNQNKPAWRRVTGLLDGMNLIPIQILLRDGLLEDITRDYKIKKILEK
jgi:hypothetical protein